MCLRVVGAAVTRTMNLEPKQVYLRVESMWVCWSLLALSLLLCAAPVGAEILPADRSDSMYHRYDGGDVTVDGPAVLVRKGFADKVSVSASYYRDSISAASPDVFIAGASPYKDSRNEYGASVSYLYDKSLMDLGYSYSNESDYTAHTMSTGVSHEMFSGLTTVSLGFTRGWDTVKQNGNPLFEESSDHYRYKLGLTQVVTKNILLNLSYEGIVDQGFLRNPYRKALLQGVAVDERYPKTRNSSAASMRVQKYWANRAANYLSYRFYDDTWDITGHTVELGYSQYFGSKWLVDFFYRYYKQSGASFYSNNFEEEKNYMARDKELSTFMSNSFGAKLSYALFTDAMWFDSGSLNLGFTYMLFNYDHYTAENPALDPGAEKYSFSPYTLQVSFSMLF